MLRAAVRANAEYHSCAHLISGTELVIAFADRLASRGTIWLLSCSNPVVIFRATQDEQAITSLGARPETI